MPLIGKEFGFWIVVGFGALAAICLLLAPLPYFQEWLDERAAQRNAGKERLALTAEQRARQFFQLQSKSMRPAVRLGAIRNRGRNDAA